MRTNCAVLECLVQLEDIVTCLLSYPNLSYPILSCTVRSQTSLSNKSFLQALTSLLSTKILHVHVPHVLE